MFTSSEEVLRFIKDESIEFVDVRFTDLPGQQQHFNVPAAGLTARPKRLAVSSSRDAQHELLDRRTAHRRAVRT